MIKIHSVNPGLLKFIKCFKANSNFEGNAMDWPGMSCDLLLGVGAGSGGIICGWSWH